MEEKRVLDYNTERGKLGMPEYGRNVQSMVEHLKTIPDRQKRSEQARAVIKTMEILNPGVHAQEDYEHKLWDHLFIISGFDLDVDSPYPMPVPEQLNEHPKAVSINKKPVKANHYGRNIESIIDLIAAQEDGENKTNMICSLAVYMRQQYLIWNKDSVADETIFADIEKLSDYRIKVPEGIELAKISSDASFSKPGLNVVKNTGKKKQFNNNRIRRKKQ